jgi:hypothetical protein
MKHTAVEWLYERLERMIPRTSLYDIDKRKYFEQAKEMEKEQIKGSWNHGFDWGMMEQSLAEQGAESTLIDAEHYYNETFKANDK